MNTSKLPPLDSIAALLADRIFALSSEEATEEHIFSMLQDMSAQIAGKIQRNKHSFMLVFSDKSVLRIDIMNEGIDIHVGQYQPDPSTDKITEINTTPFIPSNQTKH